MIPLSSARARGVRFSRVLALALALLLGLWLTQAALIALATAPAAAGQPILQTTPAAAATDAALSGAPGAQAVAIDIGRGVMLPNPADHYAVTRIGIEEKDGRPCVLTLWGRMVDPHYAGAGSRELARLELGRCRGRGGWIDPAAAGFRSERRFVRALRVCAGHPGAGRQPAAWSSAAWDIKGLMVQPAALAQPDGQVEALPDLASFTRPGCPKQVADAAFAAGWTGWSACPAGQLVTGLRAHYYDDRYLTGLSVRCKPLAWGAPDRAPRRDAIGY